MSESVDTTAEPAWEDSRCPDCGNVEHSATCPRAKQKKAVVVETDAA